MINIKYNQLEKRCDEMHYSNDSIFIHDLDGNILDVNPRVVDLFGYSRSAILSMNISSLHPSWALNRSKRAFASIQQDGYVNIDVDFQKKNGDVFIGDVFSSLIQINHMQVVLGIVRDITDRKQAENAVRDSEKNGLEKQEDKPQISPVNLSIEATIYISCCWPYLIHLGLFLFPQV
ncbi:MAG: PAS domain S-box protein, partial [Desulfobacterales bacterium]